MKVNILHHKITFECRTEYYYAKYYSCLNIIRYRSIPVSSIKMITPLQLYIFRCEILLQNCFSGDFVFITRLPSTTLYQVYTAHLTVSHPVCSRNAPQRIYTSLTPHNPLCAERRVFPNQIQHPVSQQQKALSRSLCLNN